LRFVLEGYDGVAVLRTIDSRRGLVVLYVGPGSETVVDLIIEDLQRSIRIEAVEEGHLDQMHYKPSQEYV
jgi:hypothetical protein